jgi:hypothetical protein
MDGWSGVTGKVASSAGTSSAWLPMSYEDFVRGLPRFLRAATDPDLVGDGVALGDDGLGLRRSHATSVDVTDDVRRSLFHEPPGALGEVGGHYTEGGEVVLAPFDHLRVVEPGELGSCLRAVSAARTSVVRSSDDPALDIVWPLRSVSPVSDAFGVSPVKDRNRLARPKRGVQFNRSNPT